MKDILGLVALVIAVSTTMLPSAIVAGAFWIGICDRLLGLNWILGLILSVIVFNIWHYGGYFISGVIVESLEN